jgi:hypothetical protein
LPHSEALAADSREQGSPETLRGNNADAERNGFADALAKGDGYGCVAAHGGQSYTRRRENNRDGRSGFSLTGRF